jgi:hypothetical protein
LNKKLHVLSFLIENKQGPPKEFVGEFRPPITPAMVAMNICKGKVTIAALSGFADLAFANIHG